MSTTGFSERRRINPVLVYAVHDAFQRDLDRLTAMADSGVINGPAIHAGWDRFTTFLGIHNTAKDTDLWPVLRAKLAGRPADLVALQHLDNQHIGLTALLDAVDAAVTYEDAPPHLGAQTRRLSEGFTAYRQHEEDIALPLVAELFTSREWTTFALEQRRLLGFVGAGSFLPWLLDEATADMQRKMLAALPPPDRLLYRTVWRPRYRRSPRWQLPAHA